MKPFVILLVTLPILSFGQGNLVPNGDFEDYSSCPWTGNAWPVTHWGNGNGLSPEYYNACFMSVNLEGEGLDTPCNNHGCQFPHSGEAYVGIWCFSTQYIDAHEYVQIELTAPLVGSIRYLISFYCSLAEVYGGYAISTLGAALTEFPPSIVGVNNSLDAVPQVLNDPLYPIIDTANWVLISDTVLSRYGGERYLTIGNFNSDGESDTTFFNPSAGASTLSYYYIDDVSVIALDSIPSGVSEAESLAFKVWPNPAQNHIGPATFDRTVG